MGLTDTRGHARRLATRSGRCTDDRIATPRSKNSCKLELCVARADATLTLPSLQRGSSHAASPSRLRWKNTRGSDHFAHPSRLRAPIDVEVLAALLVGERPPGLPPGNREEIVDVERPDPDTVAPARGGELHPVWTESHTLYGASGPSLARHEALLGVARGEKSHRREITTDETEVATRP